MSGLKPKRPSTAGPRRPADALSAPLGWGDELREQAAAVNVTVTKPAAVPDRPDAGTSQTELTYGDTNQPGADIYGKVSATKRATSASAYGAGSSTSAKPKSASKPTSARKATVTFAQPATKLVPTTVSYLPVKFRTVISPSEISIQKCLDRRVRWRNTRSTRCKSRYP
eukprot:265737-Prorocentrum_minimum.AAC.1